MLHPVLHTILHARHAVLKWMAIHLSLLMIYNTCAVMVVEPLRFVRYTRAS